MHHQHLIHPRVGACDRVVSVDGGSDNDASTRQMTPASAFQRGHNKPAQFPGYIQHHLPGSPSARVLRTMYNYTDAAYRRHIPRMAATSAASLALGSGLSLFVSSRWHVTRPACSNARISRIQTMPPPTLSHSDPTIAFVTICAIPHSSFPKNVTCIQSMVYTEAIFYSDTTMSPKLQHPSKSFVSYFFEVLFKLWKCFLAVDMKYEQELEC